MSINNLVINFSQLLRLNVLIRGTTSRYIPLSISLIPKMPFLCLRQRQKGDEDELTTKLLKYHI